MGHFDADLGWVGLALGLVVTLLVDLGVALEDLAGLDGGTGKPKPSQQNQVSEQFAQPCMPFK